ncbi:MAG: InlB B-repeat-containing protein [Oscillospiraceae bacterium]|nr:InlB B-repeat-containing protein [Oscillospiraceae bacterium]
MPLTLASAITRANAPAGSFTVTYNYNGSGAANTTASAARTTSYAFSKWNTKSDGSGTSYSAGASYMANASATLYAQWTSTTSTAAVTLPSPTRTGFSFKGWYSAASGGTKRGDGGASYSPTGNETLYAQWTALASTIASRSASVETTNSLALTVSRKSSSYYHKATFKIGSTVLATSSAFATSLSYPVPRTWFNSYPNDTSKTVTVSVQTFTTSACTTTVGSPATTTFTMKADAGMKPTVSSGWATHAYDNTGTAAANIVGYVKGYSKATISFDTSKITMANNATIRSYSIKCQDVTVSASPYRTPVLTSTSAAVVCTVTDSRGRTASGTLTIPVMNYAPPRLSDISVFRCDGDGNADPDGTSYSVRAIRTYSPLNGQNSCTLQVRLGSSANPYYDLTSGVATRKSGISADVTYLVTIKATDALNNSVFYYAQIPSRKWAMKFRPTGNGVAFGKAAEYDNTFEVTPDWAVKLGQPLPVTSGGTGAATAAAARANLGAFYLGMTTALVAGNDLNNFRTAGSYYSTSSTVSAGISNTPTTAQGYRLDVIVTSNVNYPTQIAVCYNGDIYRRSLVVINNVDTWKSWEKVLTGTAAIADGGTGATTASAALSNLGGLPSVTLTNMTANTTAALLSALNADISAVPTGASVVRCGNSSNAYRCLLLVIRASTTLGKAISISSYSALHNISLSLGSSGWAVG